MGKKILILNGSPVKDGNTAALVRWFAEDAESRGSDVAVVNVASLKLKGHGCSSCRSCQRSKEYACVIDDEAKSVLAAMTRTDVIVMATPLYFFSASAQLKIVFDRMFSLYKWDNLANTMTTPLKGKTFVLIGSAFEDVGLEALEKPFSLTADYTDMKFASLLVANAGESGGIHKVSGVREKVRALAEKVV